MAGLMRFDMSAAMALAGVAMSASGGCAWFIGADWSSYIPGGGSGGAAGNAGSSDGSGTGAGGTGGSAQGSGGGGGDGDGGGGGGSVPECSADEDECSENTPRRCVDGQWENGEPCVGQTCVDGTCIGRCGPGEARCLNNQPQWCHELGDWEDAKLCTAAAPVCEGGKCLPRSCVGLTETCGPDGDESCCATGEAVPGGTFNRSNDPGYPATVSGFLLDRFEVTVGRFRKFVEAYPGSKPAAGAGAHPLIEGSGWNAGWASNLPADAAALKVAVMCSPSYQTWTDAAGDHELLPMNCLTWYVAFAFCAWDGGRLATEAEWNYAAAGGGGADGQREYPWSVPANSTTISNSYAVYDCGPSGSCTFSDILPVGSRSAGDGRWGQADLAGNMWEWVLDRYANPYPADQCNNCAVLTSGSDRVLRGGSWGSDASYLLSSRRNDIAPSLRDGNIGARCARTP